MKIVVVGLGYVGLSNAILLSLGNDVIGLDINEEKIELINNKISPLRDDLIIEYLKNKKLNFSALSYDINIFEDSDLVVLSLPTNYNEDEKYFDTHFLDEAIKDIKFINKEVPILIKSTIPIGYTRSMNNKYNCDNIVFSPEFLREGQALYDCLNPSRIIVSDTGDLGKSIAELYKSVSNNNPTTLLMESDEAESVKLFANTYLAMRVSFFNELDNFALSKNLNTKDIINGISADPRIGNYYNNPSFGYGGYCLPKDTKQLYSNFDGVPNALFEAIINSNKIRKDYISKDILKSNPRVIGIYRLVMKSGSDNFRQSAIFDVINSLKEYGIEIIIYEPTLNGNNYETFKVTNDIKVLKDADIIIANRTSYELEDAKEKVYTRDIYNRD